MERSALLAAGAAIVRLQVCHPIRGRSLERPPLLRLFAIPKASARCSTALGSYIGYCRSLSSSPSSSDLSSALSAANPPEAPARTGAPGMALIENISDTGTRLTEPAGPLRRLITPEVGHHRATTKILQSRLSSISKRVGMTCRSKLTQEAEIFIFL